MPDSLPHLVPLDIDAEQDARLAELERLARAPVSSPVRDALRSLGLAILSALTDAVRGSGPGWIVRTLAILLGLAAGLKSGLVAPGEVMPAVVSAVLGIEEAPAVVVPEAAGAPDLGDDTSAP